MKHSVLFSRTKPWQSTSLQPLLLLQIPCRRWEIAHCLLKYHMCSIVVMQAKQWAPRSNIGPDTGTLNVERGSLAWNGNSSPAQFPMSIHQLSCPNYTGKAVTIWTQFKFKSFLETTGSCHEINYVMPESMLDKLSQGCEPWPCVRWIFKTTRRIFMHPYLHN